MQSAVALEPEIVAYVDDAVRRLQWDIPDERLPRLRESVGALRGGAGHRIDGSLVRPLEDEQRALVRGEADDSIAVLRVDVDRAGIFARPGGDGAVGAIGEARGVGVGARRPEAILMPADAAADRGVGERSHVAGVVVLQ